MNAKEKAMQYLISKGWVESLGEDLGIVSELETREIIEYLLDFAKEEAIEAFKAGKQAGVDEGNTEGSKFSQSVDEYLKERFDG